MIGCNSWHIHLGHVGTTTKPVPEKIPSVAAMVYSHSGVTGFSLSLPLT